MSTKDTNKTKGARDGKAIPVDKTAPLPVFDGAIEEAHSDTLTTNMSEDDFRALLEKEGATATPAAATSPTSSDPAAEDTPKMLDLLDDMDATMEDGASSDSATSDAALSETPSSAAADVPFDPDALGRPFDENALDAALNAAPAAQPSTPASAPETPQASAAEEPSVPAPETDPTPVFEAEAEAESEAGAPPENDPESEPEPEPSGPAYGTPQWERALRIALDQAVCKINELVAAQLAEIMAHKKFLHMQSCWLGVHLLCEKSMGRSDCEIEILDISKDDLMDDFDDSPDPSESGLFFHLYKNEYDQAGGKPFSAILMHYEFTHKSMDLRLMKMISMVAASCHCPAVGNAGAGLFSKRSIRDIEEITDFRLHFNGGEFTKWRSFREAEDTRYMALTLPNIKLHKRRTNLPPLYCRHWFLRDSMHGWIPATYAFGLVLIHSFLRHGWCIYIRGPRTGGLVGDIVPADMGTKGFTTRDIPLEVSISDQNEHEIAGQGFIPFTYYKEWDRVCLFSAPSLQKAERKTGGESTFDRIAASMAYLFLVCRLAHFTKVIQRENIGTTKEALELEREINGWLKGLITKMPNPEVQLRSMYPLRDGMVRVTEDPSSPGFYRAKLVVQPHLQLEGVNAELTLISKMPREKEQ